MSEEVYCTLLLNDRYLPGAQVVAHSLRDAGTKKRLAVMVTLDNVSQETVLELKKLYDYVIPVETIKSGVHAGLDLMNRRDLGSAFTKINLWRQTQFSKIVYLDADTVALRAPDELFDVKAPFAASPDIGWPDCFNSGVMVLSPSNETFGKLEKMASEGDSFDGADQGLLNQAFEGDWHRLPFTYNVTPSASYEYAPAFARYGKDTSIAHFIGAIKPWDGSPPSPSSSSGSGKPGGTTHSQLSGSWWSVWMKHYGDKHYGGEAAHTAFPSMYGAGYVATPSSMATGVPVQDAKLHQAIPVGLHAMDHSSREEPEHVQLGPTGLPIVPEIQEQLERSTEDEAGESQEEPEVRKKLLDIQAATSPTDEQRAEYMQLLSHYQQLMQHGFLPEFIETPDGPIPQANFFMIGENQYQIAEWPSHDASPKVVQSSFQQVVVGGRVSTPFVDQSTSDDDQTPHQSPQLSGWDPARSGPPTGGRPEAANLNFNSYQNQWDAADHARSSVLFLPETEPKRAAEPPPKPIFPWETKPRTVSRVFADDESSSLAETEELTDDFTEEEEESTEEEEYFPRTIGLGPQNPQSWGSYSVENQWDGDSRIGDYVREFTRRQGPSTPPNERDEAPSLPLTPVPRRRAQWPMETPTDTAQAWDPAAKLEELRSLPTSVLKTLLQAKTAESATQTDASAQAESKGLAPARTLRNSSSQTDLSMSDSLMYQGAPVEDKPTTAPALESPHIVIPTNPLASSSNVQVNAFTSTDDEADVDLKKIAGIPVAVADVEIASPTPVKEGRFQVSAIGDNEDAKQDVGVASISEVKTTKPATEEAEEESVERADVDHGGSSADAVGSSAVSEVFPIAPISVSPTILSVPDRSDSQTPTQLQISALRSPVISVSPAPHSPLPPSPPLSPLESRISQGRSQESSPSHSQTATPRALSPVLQDETPVASSPTSFQAPVMQVATPSVLELEKPLAPPPSRLQSFQAPSPPSKSPPPVPQETSSRSPSPAPPPKASSPVAVTEPDAPPSPTSEYSVETTEEEDAPLLSPRKAAVLPALYAKGAHEAGSSVVLSPSQNPFLDPPSEADPEEFSPLLSPRVVVEKPSPLLSAEERSEADFSEHLSEIASAKSSPVFTPREIILSALHSEPRLGSPIKGYGESLMPFSLDSEKDAPHVEEEEDKEHLPSVGVKEHENDDVYSDNWSESDVTEHEDDAVSPGLAIKAASPVLLPEEAPEINVDVPGLSEKLISEEKEDEALSAASLEGEKETSPLLSPEAAIEKPIEAPILAQEHDDEEDEPPASLETAQQASPTISPNLVASEETPQESSIEAPILAEEQDSEEEDDLPPIVSREHASPAVSPNLVATEVEEEEEAAPESGIETPILAEEHDDEKKDEVLPIASLETEKESSPIQSPSLVAGDEEELPIAGETSEQTPEEGVEAPVLADEQPEEKEEALPTNLPQTEKEPSPVQSPALVAEEEEEPEFEHVENPALDEEAATQAEDEVLPTPRTGTPIPSPTLPASLGPASPNLSASPSPALDPVAEEEEEEDDLPTSSLEPAEDSVPISAPIEGLQPAPEVDVASSILSPPPAEISRQPTPEIVISSPTLSAEPGPEEKQEEEDDDAPDPTSPLAASEASSEPEIDVAPLELSSDAAREEERAESPEVLANDDALVEEPAHEDLESVHEDLEPAHEDLESVHEDLEPAHEDLETAPKEIEPELPAAEPEVDVASPANEAQEEEEDEPAIPSEDIVSSPVLSAAEEKDDEESILSQDIGDEVSTEVTPEEVHETVIFPGRDASPVQARELPKETSPERKAVEKEEDVESEEEHETVIFPGRQAEESVKEDEEDVPEEPEEVPEVATEEEKPEDDVASHPRPSSPTLASVPAPEEESEPEPEEQEQQVEEEKTEEVEPPLLEPANAKNELASPEEVKPAAETLPEKEPTEKEPAALATLPPKQSSPVSVQTAAVMAVAATGLGIALTYLYGSMGASMGAGGGAAGGAGMGGE